VTAREEGMNKDAFFKRAEGMMLGVEMSDGAILPGTHPEWKWDRRN